MYTYTPPRSEIEVDLDCVFGRAVDVSREGGGVEFDWQESLDEW